MKREYSKPAMNVEVFEANEYVAACYIVNCNVPSGFGFIDNNKNKKYDRGIDTYLASGYGCNVEHKGVNEPKGPHYNSMWKPDDGQAFDTYYWHQDVHGYGKKDIHFTRDIKWETNPNAS